MVNIAEAADASIRAAGSFASAKRPAEKHKTAQEPSRFLSVQYHSIRTTR